MQNAYDLTWKLTLVLKGHVKRNIPETYNFERKHIAEQKDLNALELYSL